LKKSAHLVIRVSSDVRLIAGEATGPLKNNYPMAGGEKMALLICLLVAALFLPLILAITPLFLALLALFVRGSKSEARVRHEGTPSHNGACGPDNARVPPVEEKKG
jgi:hypothetical protein